MSVVIKFDGNECVANSCGTRHSEFLQQLAKKFMATDLSMEEAFKAVKEPNAITSKLAELKSEMPKFEFGKVVGGDAPNSQAVGNAPRVTSTQLG